MSEKTKLSLAKETKQILQENGIILNKNLGQNYLIDDFKRKKIIKYAKLSKEDIVLEIGPGIGTLTIELAKNAKKVIAIEQDATIFNILKKRLEREGIDNIELINEDAVKVDFPEFNKIVSNLPYQISSPISFKFLKHKFDLAILMYQKEFADRMNGKVGTKQYSRLSAMLYFKADVKFLTKVSPESFIPSPKVDSSVIQLKPKDIKTIKIDGEEFKINDESYKIYSKVVKALFQHRNKKSKNALIDSRHMIGFKDKKELKSVLKHLEDKNPKFKELLLERTINLSPESIMELSILLKDHL
ncbi:16S rRNA (adenine(1518)-N(6)/adenine(1519)-N(6))-dimethyltransferase RsmA [Methanobrevibacter olleyae]|uniref:Probable ribosomal RNA small subunit methyltransferase A n=1 Tax=Methanobrevibacter olleyae TaxID=294671 RepID=A0A126R342_METOL|nr:16S rRNA (adenine(1518)-N(6)/adenine(1519)-N(6))-dimethyltransferase RsmA [Methanobrevibacter olleyae]AMK16075.1 dimethyladenosine transferase KsgA [Methanobrevibacter olleyae]SFL75537.1 16S rRNA (adenine1518-N6/adenine1519-N6)-dimethyltransferase [Methanobrevibacter olleyae]